MSFTYRHNAVIFKRGVASVDIFITFILAMIYSIHLHRVRRSKSEKHDLWLILFQLLACLMSMILGITTIIASTIAGRSQLACTIAAPLGSTVYTWNKLFVYMYLIRRLDIIKSSGLDIQHDKILKGFKYLLFSFFLISLVIILNATGIINDGLCRSHFWLPLSAFLTLVDFGISAGCLYLFQNIFSNHAISERMKNIGKRNYQGGLIAIGTSILTVITIGIVRAITNNETINHIVSSLSMIDTLINSTSIFYVNKSGIMQVSDKSSRPESVPEPYSIKLFGIRIGPSKESRKIQVDPSDVLHLSQGREKIEVDRSDMVMM